MKCVDAAKMNKNGICSIHLNFYAQTELLNEIQAGRSSMSPKQMSAKLVDAQEYGEE